MTIAELKTKIEQRGFTVEAINSNGNKHELVVKGKDGSKVAWPVIMTGKSGAINGVGIKSYHPPKVDGQNEHSTVAVFGDLYLQHNNKPSTADKAVAELLKPKADVQHETEPKVKAEPKQEAKAPEAPKAASTKKSSGKQHQAQATA